MRHEKFPEVSSCSAPAEVRQSPRAAVSLWAEVKIGAMGWHKTRLHDLSETGFGISWLPWPCESDRIYIRIDGLEAIPATVRWRNGRALGCTFDRPLSPYIFEHLQRAAH